MPQNHLAVRGLAVCQGEDIRAARCGGFFPLTPALSLGERVNPSLRGEQPSPVGFPLSDARCSLSLRERVRVRGNGGNYPLAYRTITATFALGESSARDEGFQNACDANRKENMAQLVLAEEKYEARFGPTPAYTPASGWDSREPDKLVKTRCCFCGVQCGIQLKVKDNQVVGFEPWEEFPVNRGMLCPKGVKRYLQGGHPDRLLSPLVRTERGFQPSTWEKSLDLVAENIRRIQDKYGRDSFAVISGASLTNEKAYLMGKFARVALR